MEKITIELERGKTVELDSFAIHRESSLSFRLRMVELDIEIIHYHDFFDFTTWQKSNPTKTWKDYIKPALLAVYDSYALAKALKDTIETGK